MLDRLLGRRVDPTDVQIVKFLPSVPPRRGETVLVDGVRGRVTYCRVRFDREPVPHPKYGLASPLYRWHLRSLRVKPLV